MAARVFWPPAFGLHLISRRFLPRVVRAFGLIAAHTLCGCGDPLVVCMPVAGSPALTYAREW